MERAAICFILLLVQSASSQLILSTCQQTQNVLEAKGYNRSFVPSAPVPGQFLQLCPESFLTCCNSRVEGIFENATNLRLASYFPPDFITNLLNALVNVVDVDSYDNPDNSVNRFIARVSTAVNRAHVSHTNSRFTSLINELKDVHGVGKNASEFDRQVKQLFAHLLLLSLQANVSLSSPSDINGEMVSCVANTAVTESLFSLETPLRAVFEQLHSVHLIRQMLIEMYTLAVELNLEFDPFTECVRAYSELVYCQACVPEDQVPQARPCRNACKNVMIGCTAFFERFRSFILKSQAYARVLDKNAASTEKSFHNAAQSLMAQINKLNSIGTATADGVDVEALIGQIQTCVSTNSGSREKRETLSISAVKTQRRFIRQLSGAVDNPTDGPISLQGIPHSLTTSLYNSVFVQMEETYLSKLDGLSVKFSNQECSHLPTTQCWNQVSLGSDTNTVVTPGVNALTANPNLVSKGDTEITTRSTAVTTREGNLAELNQMTNELLGIVNTPTDAATHTPVQGLLVVMATIIAAIFMQLV